LCEAGFVLLFKLRDGNFGGRRTERTDRILHRLRNQMGNAPTNEIAHDRCLQRAKTKRGAHLIDGQSNVRCGVEQCSVQIE